MRAVLALGLLLAFGPAFSFPPQSSPRSAQSSPLPDRETFYRETRANLERSQREQFRFFFGFAEPEPDLLKDRLHA